MLYWIPALATAALIAALSHQPQLPELPGGPPDWLLHGIEYGFFALTCIWGTTRGFAASLRSPGRLLSALLIAALYGISDEWHQSFIVGRDATVRDWLADCAGAALMGLAVLATWRLRRDSDADA